jgi:nitrite reductase (cytochrome c-552)
MTRDPRTLGSNEPAPTRERRTRALAVLLALVAVGFFAVLALAMTIVRHREDAQRPFVRLVEVHENMSNPVPWGQNWPRQFDSYKRTVDVTRTRYGGSSAMPESKLDEQPWLRRLYAGYAFSIDYRERRGHAYMLYDQEVTERVLQRPQSGACLHCHASVVPMYRRLGLEALGRAADADAEGRDFDWEAVNRGFELSARMTWADAHRELLLTPDGAPTGTPPLFPGGMHARARNPDGSARIDEVQDPHLGTGHPVSCVDCHDPQTMQPRVTRPGFMQGIADLAASDDPVPHLPSVERWREGSRVRPYDPNVDATRQEMRSFVCGQCHVEYYCATRETLFFPWGRGLKVEQIEQVFEEHAFPDGEPFYDWIHGETGARSFKAQHPEFEMWSQGVHARSGVSCSDCHMPYVREGAMKVSSHWVKSPLLSIQESCQGCHRVPESELLGKVHAIQDRTHALIGRAADAMTDMLDAIREAQAAGATTEQLAPILVLQRKAMWRLDFVSSENSMGFHADQESARILADSIDYSRRAQSAALRLRAPAAPDVTAPTEPVHGVTPAAHAPPAANYGQGERGAR